MLTRHFARKHTQAEPAYPCCKCGKRFMTSSDRATHEPTCLHGPDEGKLLQCAACGIQLPTPSTWRAHRHMTGHANFTHCWPDGSPAAPGYPRGAAVDAADAEGLDAAADAPEEEEAIIVHIRRVAPASPSGAPAAAALLQLGPPR